MCDKCLEWIYWVYNQIREEEKNKVDEWLLDSKEFSERVSEKVEWIINLKSNISRKVYYTDMEDWEENEFTINDWEREIKEEWGHF